MLTEEQISYFLPQACNAAIRAGAAIMEVYNDSEQIEVTLKSDHSPITIADRRAHTIIREYLSPTRVPLLSEEGREMLYDERRGWDLFWMIDPLDGTKEFIKANGEFTVNIALLVNNVPALAVVYVPCLEKLYYAVDGLGSYLKTAIAPDACASYELGFYLTSRRQLPIAEAVNKPVRIAVSRSHRNEATSRIIEVFRRIYPDAVEVEQGSSYKFCMLAEGAADCYIRTSNTYEWDTAAGGLILEAAGGRVLAMPDKEPMEYNKHTLINPYFICVSKHMRGIIKKAAF